MKAYLRVFVLGVAGAVACASACFSTPSVFPCAVDGTCPPGTLNANIYKCAGGTCRATCNDIGAKSSACGSNEVCAGLDSQFEGFCAPKCSTTPSPLTTASSGGAANPCPDGLFCNSQGYCDRCTAHEGDCAPDECCAVLTSTNAYTRAQAGSVLGCVKTSGMLKSMGCLGPGRSTGGAGADAATAADAAWGSSSSSSGSPSSSSSSSSSAGGPGFDASGGCAVVPTGLVSWWAGEGTTADLIGGNTGQFNGTYSTGKVGRAFAFYGASGASAFSAPTIGFPVGSADRTIELWMMADGATSSLPAAFIAGYGDRTRGGGFDLVYNQSSVVWTSMAPPSATAPNVGPNSWHHVAAALGSVDLTLYVDGVAVTSVPASLVTSPGTNFDMGFTNLGPGGSYYFTGMIDEVSVYSRALTAAEIAAIYAAGSAGKCPVP